MSKIFKIVSVHDNPVIIYHKDPDVRPKKELELPSDSAIAVTDAGAQEEQQPEPVIVDAKKQAETIIREAKEQASEIIALAERTAEEIKSNAYNEAYKLGHDEGVSQGQTEGFSQGKTMALEQSRTTIEESVQRAEQLLRAADGEAKRMIDGAERQVIEIALAVSRKILNREIEENPVVTIPIVKAALDKVKDQDEITIRVSPFSYDFVLLGKQELQSTLLKDCSLTIIADENLKEGDCVIETPFGTIDATVDSQMDNIINSLQEVMP